MRVRFVIILDRHTLPFMGLWSRGHSPKQEQQRRVQAPEGSSSSSASPSAMRYTAKAVKRWVWM
jgi:hypothetical protein